MWAKIIMQLNPFLTLQVRYDTRCYFNMRSNDTSQLNLPTVNLNVKYIQQIRIIAYCCLKATGTVVKQA